MLYVILGRDAPGALEIRRRVRARHLERIGALAQAGRVALAGPCPAVDAPDPGSAGFSGSLIVAEFESIAGGPRLDCRRPLRHRGGLRLRTR